MANYDFKGPPDNNLTTTEVLLWNMGIVLRQILEAQAGLIPNPLPVTFTGSPEKPSFSTVSAVGPGTIAAGAKSLVIITDSNFSGTFGGDSYTGEQTIPISASLGSTLAAVNYELIAGTFKIIRIE